MGDLIRGNNIEELLGLVPEAIEEVKKEIEDTFSIKKWDYASLAASNMSLMAESFGLGVL